MRAARTLAERSPSSGSACSRTQAMSAPPSPPRRKSSRHNRTLKLYSETRLIDSSHSSKPRHEQCFAADSVSSIRSLRERFCSNLERRSREHLISAQRSPVTGKTAKTPGLLPAAFSKRKSDPCLSQFEANPGKRLSSTAGSRSHVCSSASPAASRGIRQKIDGKRPVEEKVPRYTSVGREGRRRSPERSPTKSESSPRKEKPRLTRREQEQSCKRLSSPVEVRKVLQKEAKDVRTKVLPSGTVVRSSTIPYSSLASRQKRPAEKSLKVVVAVSPKGQELLRKEPKKTSSQPRSAPVRGASSRNFTEPRKTRVAAKPPEKLIVSKESLVSSSEVSGEVNKRKPQTIVPMRKPETIRVANGSRKKVEARKKTRREKTGRPSSSWREMAEREDIKLLRKVPSIAQETAPLTVEEIKRHQEATRTDTFFQNLFLRNPPKRSLVGERTKMLQDMANYKSEPSLKSLSVYLAHKRPVSNSKFKNWERDSVSSRSSSPPYGVCWPGRSLLQKVSKFDSLLGIDEFGSLRSPELSHVKERSLSEPPLKTESSPRSSSPSPTRAETPRQIRGVSKQDTPKKIRARSAGEAKRPLGSTLSLTKSTGSLSDREDYQQYILELLHHRRKSRRYKDLRDFYASLSRMGQLERTFSSGELRPRMRNEEIIDYERWQRVRSKEKAEQELKALCGKLRSVQRDKDFLFTVRDVDKFRWHGDCGLRCKERSVEDILQYFKKLENEESELESSKRRNISLQKDTYKPLWRGSSVVNVASAMQRKANGGQDGEHPSSLQRSLGGSKKFWSSLSIEQVATLKKQLNEIYGSDGPQKAAAVRSNGEVEDKRESLSRYEIIVPAGRPQGDSKGLHVRCHSMISQSAMLLKESEASRVEASKKSDSKGGIIERSPTMSELEKKRLSLTLGKEVLDKMTRRRMSAPLAPRETRGSIAAALAKVSSRKEVASCPSGTASVASTSPRTCYSLEAEDSTRLKDKSDFLLVLTPNNETDKQRVETVLEEWSKKPPLLAVEAPTTKAGRLGPGSDADSMTESSEASVRTVIQRNVETEDVSRKIEFFENVERRGEAHRGWKKLSSSQSFADLKELFGETESAKYSGPAGSRSRSPTLLDDTRRQLPSCSRERERERARSVSPCRSNSSCSLDSGWLRSSSPDPERYWRAYLKLVRNGTVRRLRARFESAEELRAKVAPTPKRFRSDPELARSLLKRASEDGAPKRADVAWLRGRFEGRRARRRGESPPIPRVPLRRENLSMPRIDVISKTAELKEPTVTSTVSNHAVRQAETKELRAKKPVCRMRKRFESPDAGRRTSVIGEMFTSAPDVRELRDIAPYLAGRWVAHRFPNRRDNMRSLSSPADLELHRGSSKKTERASSPTPASILKPSQNIFAGQHFDPDKHRPRFRYQPPPPPPSPAGGRKHGTLWPTLPVYTARPTVTFEGLNPAGLRSAREADERDEI
ncbi:PREDICTED: uncharacterized protein LOC106749540 [Dinoponera quadriceps]|uniref:Uncharacterized protein LOC106749540 n=1 Tax=Dinoponera quadriceps TaxID=609295 RepID=A0A6P3Y307_DINQU|nr:PREDICTED: uncharacterized protein LOC106749540 [Dinoponera quadriceps]